ncbi:MAG TPA: O-antigen ligase family protein [Actinomycetota bacterium]|nr:O-antigen ligase family protein [Actinomycetota bacterium]
MLPVALAACAAALSALVVRSTPFPLAVAAVLGAAAIITVRANPVLAIAVLAVIRATLEGFGAQTVTRVASVQLSPTDVVTLAFTLGAVWWLLSRMRRGIFDWQAPTLFPALIFFAIAAASLTYSSDWALGARDLLKFFGGYCAFLVIINERPDARKLRLILALIVLSAIAPLLIGWYQFTNNIGKPGLFHGGLRIQSTFDHPNTYGFYLVSVLTACWGLSRTLSDRWRRVVEAVAIACFIAIAMTLSRNTWAATAVLVLVVGHKYRRVLVAAALIAVGVVVAMPRTIGAIAGIFNPRTGTNRGGSALGRLDLWARDLSVWQQSPIFGKGFGSTKGNTGALAHNDYMRSLVEGGIIGLAAFVVFLGSLLRASWRAAAGRGDLPLACLGLTIGYLLVSAGSNNMGKDAFQFYFWTIVGVSYVWAQIVPPSEDERERLPRSEDLVSSPS